MSFRMPTVALPRPRLGNAPTLGRPLPRAAQAGLVESQADLAELGLEDVLDQPRAESSLRRRRD